MTAVGPSSVEGAAGVSDFGAGDGAVRVGDPQDAESWRRLGKGEKPRAGETVRTKMVGVRPTYVWDASQTTGEPIPEPRAPRLLEGQAPAGLWEGLAAQVQSAGFELRLVADASEIVGANRVTDYANHVVSVRTAVAGTVFIAIGAFWLSFTALADLAARSGIGTGQAWARPLIVDGIIVVATVAVVALAGQKAAWYPWALLIGGAVVSVTANALTCAQDSNKARIETIDDGKGSSLVRGVGTGGLSPNTPDGEGSGRYPNGKGNRRKHHVDRQAVRYPSGDSVGAHEAVTSASHEQLLSANHSQSGSSAMPLSVLLRRLSLRVASRLELEWR